MVVTYEHVVSIGVGMVFISTLVDIVQGTRNIRDAAPELICMGIILFGVFRAFG